MSTTSVHDIKVTIGDTTQHATSKELAKTFLEEFAKISKEDAEKKTAFKQMEVQLTAPKKGATAPTSKTNTTPTTTSAKGGAHASKVGKVSSPTAAPSTTPSAPGGSSTNTSASTEGGAPVTPPNTDSNTPSVPEVSATSETALPKNTAQPTAETSVTQENNNDDSLRSQLTTKFSSYIHDSFGQVAHPDTQRKYEKIILELKDDSIPLEKILLKHPEAMTFYKEIAKKDDTTIDWTDLRQKMAANINNHLTDSRDDKRNRYWEYLKQELENPATDIHTLFENHNDLFYLLDTVLEIPEFIAISERLKCKLSVTLPGSKNVYNYKLSTKAIYGILKKRKESIDPNGASVFKVRTKLNTYSYLPNIPIEFIAHKANTTNTEKINWIVYNNKGEKIKEHIDVGLEFTYTFPEKGNYIVEAYGSGKRKRNIEAAQKSSEAKADSRDRKSYIAIAITHPKIASIATSFKKDIRFDTSKTHEFTILSNIAETEKDIKDITWQVFYSDSEKGVFNGECQDLSKYNNNIKASLTFAKEGYYMVVARAMGSKDVSTEFKVSGNYVTKIQANTATLLYKKPNQKLTLTATNFKFSATDEDKKMVHWKALLGTTDVFKAAKPTGAQIQPGKLQDAEEGEYTICAYTPNSLFGKKATTKVTVVHPTVTEAYFTNKGGSKKESTGYIEDAYIYAQLDNYTKQEVEVQVWSDKELLQSFTKVKTNEFSEVKDLKFTLTAKDKVRITKPLRFTVKGTDGYKLKNQDRNFPKNGLQVLDTQEITDTYFTYGGSKVTDKYVVPYKTALKAVVETANYIGEEITVSIFRATEKIFPMQPTESISQTTQKVGADGTVVIDFKLAEVLSTNHDKGKYFYMEVSTPDKDTCGAKETILNSAILSYKEGDVLEDGKEFMARAPWMKKVISEAKKGKGEKEWIYPLTEMVEKYHKYSGNNGSYSTAWCASFVSWALGSSKYDNPKSVASRSYIDHPSLRKINTPVFGAIAVFSDCNKNGKIKRQGHVAFVYGKISGSTYACLGGNQGDRLKVSSYDCSGNVFKSYTDKKGIIHYKIFRGFYVPKDFDIKTSDKLTEKDVYSSSKIANKQLLKKDIKSSKNGESSR